MREKEIKKREKQTLINYLKSQMISYIKYFSVLFSISAMRTISIVVTKRTLEMKFLHGKYSSQLKCCT